MSRERTIEESKPIKSTPLTQAQDLKLCECDEGSCVNCDNCGGCDPGDGIKPVLNPVGSRKSA